MRPATASSLVRGQVGPLWHPLPAHHINVLLIIYLLFCAHTGNTRVSLFFSCTHSQLGHAELAMAHRHSCSKPRVIKETLTGAMPTEERKGEHL